MLASNSKAIQLIKSRLTYQEILSTTNLVGIWALAVATKAMATTAMEPVTTMDYQTPEDMAVLIMGIHTAMEARLTMGIAAMEMARTMVTRTRLGL